MEWTNIVTAAVALYGAILSTYTILANRKNKRRQIKVKLSNGLLTSGPELSPAMLLIEASNPGDRSVILNTAGIRLPDGKTVVFPIPESNVVFPHTLEEGKSCLVWTPVKKFASTLRNGGYKGTVKIVAFYRDQLGKEHRSKKFGFDIDGWPD